MRTTYCKSWTKNGLTILGQLKKQANTHSFIFDRPYLVWGERVSASYALASCSGRRSGGCLHHPCAPKGAMCRHHLHRMIGRIAVGNFRLRRPRTGLRPTFAKLRLAKLTYWVAPSRQPRNRYIAHFKISLGCSAIAVKNSPSKSDFSSDGIAANISRISTINLPKTASVSLMLICTCFFSVSSLQSFEHYRVFR